MALMACKQVACRERAVLAILAILASWLARSLPGSQNALRPSFSHDAQRLLPVNKHGGHSENRVFDAGDGFILDYNGPVPHTAAFHA